MNTIVFFKPCISFLLITILTTIKINSQDLTSLKDQEPFRVDGSISATAVFYNIEGREAYREPFSWILRGAPVFNIYGISIPVTIIVSEQERDFRQPFNRFGVSPTYKWVRLNLGYQNLQYSRFSLAGHSMVGAGLEINPGKLRLGFMHGNLLRAVQPSSLIDDHDFRVIPAYKRIGNVLKLGYGSDENYIDLIILDARDIESSLDSVPAGSSLTPAENLITALKTHQVIFKKLHVEMEVAQSIYTEDIRSESVSIEDQIFLPVSSLIDTRTSTVVRNAINAAVKYQGDAFFGGISFERIDPGYKSMGAYFFLNDIQRVTVTPGVRLFKDKIQLRANLGFQENNLGDTKDRKTIRRVGSLFLNARIGNIYQFDGSYSNYGVEQKEGLQVVDPATNIAQVTQQWNMNHIFTFQGESAMQNINLSFNSQALDDQNENTSAFSNYNSSVYAGAYMLSFLPICLSLNAGITYTRYGVAGQDIRYLGPMLGANKSFLDNKLQLALTGNYFMNRKNDELIRKTTRIMLRSSYRIGKRQKLSLRAQLGQSEYPVEPEKSYNETKVELSYAYRF